MFQWSDTRGGSQRTVVMGCGKLGAVVAASLADNGHSVHVLDTRTEAFERLPLDKTESGQIVPIVADGTVQQDLVNSSVPDADVFMALSSVETRNALAAQLAKNVFHVPKVVCLIDAPDLQAMYNSLDLVATSATALLARIVVEAASV